MSEAPRKHHSFTQAELIYGEIEAAEKQLRDACGAVHLQEGLLQHQSEQIAPSSEDYAELKNLAKDLTAVQLGSQAGPSVC